MRSVEIRVWGLSRRNNLRISIPKEAKTSKKKSFKLLKLIICNNRR